MKINHSLYVDKPIAYHLFIASIIWPLSSILIFIYVLGYLIVKMGYVFNYAAAKITHLLGKRYRKFFVGDRPDEKNTRK